jgi:hypothetical protein
LLYTLIGFLLGQTVPGRTSQALITIFFGVGQLGCLAIIVAYLGRMSTQLKGRPLFLIKEIVTSQSQAILNERACRKTGMKISEFDKFAEEYLALHAQNIRISGENPEYFSRYKVQELRRRWSGRAEPETILDFGTGIGSSLPHLASRFPKSRLIALDVSEKSLEIAAKRFP